LVCNSARDDYELLRTCVNAELCDAEADLGCIDATCGPGDFRCSGAELQYCNATQNGWVTLQECTSAAHCFAGGSMPQCSTAPCTTGEWECNGTELRRCTGDTEGWVEQEQCLTAELCDASLPGCKQPACTVGEYSCDGSELSFCGNDGEPSEGIDCLTPALCEMSAGLGRGECEEPLCSAGQFVCASNVLQVCADGRDGFVTKETCVTASQCNATKGACVECVPGEDWQCNGTRLEKCTTEGWQLDELCVTSNACSASDQACKEPVCDADQYRCNATTGNLERCAADRLSWNVSKVCTSTQICDLAGRQCDVCDSTDDSQTCQGDKLVQCSADGQTLLTINCPFGCQGDACAGATGGTGGGGGAGGTGSGGTNTGGMQNTGGNGSDDEITCLGDPSPRRVWSFDADLEGWTRVNNGNKTATLTWSESVGKPVAGALRYDATSGNGLIGDMVNSLPTVVDLSGRTLSAWVRLQSGSAQVNFMAATALANPAIGPKVTLSANTWTCVSFDPDNPTSVPSGYDASRVRYIGLQSTGSAPFQIYVDQVAY